MGILPASLESAGGIGGLLSIYDTVGTGSTSDDRSLAFFYDANGNVGQLLELTAASNYGSVAVKYEYDAYGNRTNTPASGEYDQPWRFSTKWFDAETGLSYYGYRYYAARMGRWVSRDPIGEIGGPSLFVGVVNDPAGSYDYLGKYVPKRNEPFDDPVVRGAPATSPVSTSKSVCCLLRSQPRYAAAYDGPLPECYRTVECNSELDPTACCECSGCDLKVVGAKEGSCCFCTIQVVTYGGFCDHHDFAISCPTFFERVYRWSAENNFCGPAPIQWGWSPKKGARVQREKLVPCDVAEALRDRLHRTYPKSSSGRPKERDCEFEFFPFIQCHTFASHWYSQVDGVSKCE